MHTSILVHACINECIRQCTAFRKRASITAMYACIEYAHTCMTQGSIHSLTLSLQKACMLASIQSKHTKNVHTHTHTHTHNHTRQTTPNSHSQRSSLFFVFFCATVLQRPRALANGLSALMSCRVWPQACVVCGPAGPGKASVSRQACGMRVSALLRTHPEQKK
jgi:hypothetical protein